MSASILVTYATRYGTTQEVAETVTATLRERGLMVDIQPMREVHTLEGYRAVVLGTALYAGHWHKDARRFLSRHHKALVERPLAIFTLGPVHADEKEWQGAHMQLDKELAKFPWLRPITVEIFGGAIVPARMHFPFNHIPAADVRDWTAIRTWASNLAAQPAMSRAGELV
ncbi:MAG TPA: flavodoxin domain-containing protein [Ktedonobacteraceae bacterium]